MRYTGIFNHRFSQWDGDTASLGEGFPNLNLTAMVECSPNGINGHRLWFDMERDGVCLVYLLRTHCADIWRELVMRSETLQPHSIMVLMMTMTTIIIIRCGSFCAICFKRPRFQGHFCLFQLTLVNLNVSRFIYTDRILTRMNTSIYPTAKQ